MKFQGKQMKKFTLIITLLFLYGCQGNETANQQQIEKQITALQQMESQVIKLQKQLTNDDKDYEAITAELEQLKLEEIDAEADYVKEQEIIEQQDARYNALLERWEKQADRMDKILDVQEKQYKVK